MAVLGLRFYARAFSSCGKWGPLFIAVRGRLLLRSTGSRRAGSVVVVHGPSCSAARGIFPDQGSNLCPLRWQADSQPLRPQGSPGSSYYYSYFIDTGSREVRLLAQGHTAGQWQKQDPSRIGPKDLLLYSASDTSWKGLGL